MKRCRVRLRHGRLRGRARSIARPTSTSTWTWRSSTRWRRSSAPGGDFALRLCHRARGRSSRAEPARHFRSRAGDAPAASAKSRATSSRCGSSCRPTAIAGLWGNHAEQGRHPRARRHRRSARLPRAPSATTGCSGTPDARSCPIPSRTALRTAQPLVPPRVQDRLASRPATPSRRPTSDRPQASGAGGICGAQAVVKAADYESMYAESIHDPEGFWARIAKRIDWMRVPDDASRTSPSIPADFRMRWYEDGELNVSVNCLDRQLEKRGDKTALLFEGDDPVGLAPHQLPRALRAGLPLRQCAAQARRRRKATASRSTCR